jgi:hypothetical protein
VDEPEAERLSPPGAVVHRRSGRGVALASSPAPAALELGGATGAAPLQAQPIGFGDKVPTLAAGERNEWGELTGELTSDVPPTVFVNGGNTGNASVWWGGGGNGGQGNQGVGTITLVAPEYEGKDPAAAGGTASAWIKSSTGKATVTRSYRGVLAGANGTYYITARAQARIDTHERLHVSSSRSIHDAQISPLETRVADRTGEAKALASGATRAAAITALKTEINWNTSVESFRTADTTANTPGGTTVSMPTTAPAPSAGSTTPTTSTRRRDRRRCPRQAVAVARRPAGRLVEQRGMGPGA